MNKAKKILSGLLLLTFVFGAFTGCEKTDTEGEESTTSTESTNNSEASSTSESKATEDNLEENAEKEKVDLHLADMSLYGIAIFNYAEEIGLLDGYFDDLDYDVNVELSEWASGVDQNSAFAAGEIDFSSMGNIPAVSGTSGGYGTKILAVNYLYDNEYVLVARTDAGIESISDLSGKNIGTYVGTVTHYAIAKYLEAGGLSIDDVNLLNVGAEAATSLRSGDIDATVIGNIEAHQLEEEGTVTILSEDQVPIYNYVIGREEYASQYPEITVRVLELINDTWDYALEHQQEYMEFYSGVSGVDLSVIEASWADNFPIKSAKDFDDEDYQQYLDFVDWMKSVDYVAEDVDADSLLDLTYVKSLTD